jgi:hypothetical protein
MTDEGQVVLEGELIDGVRFVDRELLLEAVAVGGNESWTVMRLLMGLDVT